MEKLYKSRMYEAVRALLDELGANDAEFMLNDTDSSELNTIIDNVAITAVRNVHLNAPGWKIEGTQAEQDDFSVATTCDRATVTLPDGYLRLVRARLSSWIVSATEATSEDTSTYQMQSNAYMRGTPRRPVCAVIRRKGDLLLEMFSPEAITDTLEEFEILLEPEWVSDESEEYIEICRRLEDSVIYQITGLTLIALGEDQRAQTFLSLSANYSQ